MSSPILQKGNLVIIVRLVCSCTHLYVLHRSHRSLHRSPGLLVLYASINPVESLAGKEEEQEETEASTVPPSVEPSRAPTPSIADDTVASELPVDEPLPVVEEVPPPPPPPPKTEEDLWIYLKDVIQSSNPLNAEELVAKLVDTVKEVPQDFLEPVVSASIRRSQSMELSNAESLPLDPPAGEGAPAEGAAPPADGAAPAEGAPAPAEGTPAPTEGAPASTEGAPAEVAPPAEGAPPAPAPTPAEGAPAPTEGAPPAEGAPAPAEAASAPAPAEAAPAPAETPAPPPVEAAA